MLIHNVPFNTQELLSLLELYQAGKKIKKKGGNSTKEILIRLDYMLWPWFERVASYGGVYQVQLPTCFLSIISHNRVCQCPPDTLVIVIVNKDV